MSNNQKAVWMVLNDSIVGVKEVLSAKTLADIQREFRNLNENLMYYI